MTSHVALAHVVGLYVCDIKTNVLNMYDVKTNAIRLMTHKMQTPKKYFAMHTFDVCSST